MIKFGEDVRNLPFAKDNLNKINEKIDLEKLLTLWYNQRTEWEGFVKSPISAEDLLELGKYPGLGIKKLHNQGITGKGVSVAIIDQPLYGQHPEYRKNIVYYKNLTDTDNSMHGPAVVSLLCGKTIGVAPDTKVFYFAVPTWDGDALYEVQALETVIQLNKTLPEDRKIKIVSVSASPSSSQHRTKNIDLWNPKVEEAFKNNILVIDCSQNKYLFDMCEYDLFDPDNLEKLTPRIGCEELEETIFLPCNNRTVAEVYNDGIYSYSHSKYGGLSWGIPYLSGLLALGWQIDPNQKSEEMMKMIKKSCYKKDNLLFLYPEAFINNVKKNKALI